MKLTRRTLLAMLAAVSLATPWPALAEVKKAFKVARSIFVGWMPWGYAADHGIVKKWADKYGLTIEMGLL